MKGTVWQTLLTCALAYLIQQGGHSYHHLANDTFIIFSALHDPKTGEVKIFAEVHPDSVCESVATCSFLAPKGSKDALNVKASADVPYAVLSAKPQLRECFVTCPLPGPGQAVGEVALRTREGATLAVHTVEEVEELAEGEAKGVGMCVGPIFSETPTLLDWLQYYTALGVQRIHMYATVADFVLARGDYMHLPGSHRPVNFEHHHLVTWRAFVASRWSQHYYGQWLIYNDCVFRTRNLHEFVMFHDRDEFVHFVGARPNQVDLSQFFERAFGAPDVASVTYWGGLYHLHCHMLSVGALGAGGAPGEAHEHAPAHRQHYQTYAGYDIWAPDARLPNFTGCTPMTCHPKSVVRPLGVDVMSVHHVKTQAKGFASGVRMLPAEAIFVKHLRCLHDPRTGEWDTTRDQPLCSAEEVLHPDPRWGGMPVCPDEVVAAVRGGEDGASPAGAPAAA